MAAKVEITESGLTIREDLSFDEWAELGTHLVRAGRTTAFLIGDWINYGESRKDYGDKYTEALKSTGYDYNTLRHFARVARQVSLCVRTHNLSWEHHRKVASLKDPDEQRRWLNVAAEAAAKGEPISTRRLGKSILRGRVVSTDELQEQDNDRGIDNVHPYVNRIVAWWGKMKRDGWLDEATEEQRANLREDLRPVVDIVRELEGLAPSKESFRANRHMGYSHRRAEAR